MEESSSSKPFASPLTVKFALSSTMASPSPGTASQDRLNSPPYAENYNNDTTVNRSVFTPILTPGTDRGKSMVLLSPSRTITETLTSLASNTGHQLEEIWDEVGSGPEERAEELSDLIVKFQEICQQKIRDEQGVAEQYRKTIAEHKEEVKATAVALHMDPETYLSTESTPQTLTDELATLEASVEGLRTAAAAAKEDLKNCLDFLLESHEALGLDIDPSWLDIESNLTARRREKFHEKQAEMKEEISSRMAAVVRLVRDCQKLMNELRMEPEEDGSDLERRIAGSLIRSKDGSFIMASKVRTDTCVGISSQALHELTRHVAVLHDEKSRRRQLLTRMGAEIAVLWEKLRVPEEYQKSFQQAMELKGFSIDTIEYGEKELDRLRTLKSEMLGNLVAEARQFIMELWEETNTTEEGRRAFAPFHVQDEELFDEALLEKHEEYCQTLHERLEQMRPLLRLIERREAVVRERIEYEELQKDSDRLKQRGAALTKQLMAEEKMAKRIKRDLPKLTETLDEKLAEWKKVHGEAFQYKGEVYSVAMERQEEEWKQYKDDEMKRKQRKKQEEKASSDVYPTYNAQPKKRTAASRPLGNNTKHNVNPSKAETSKSRPQSNGVGTKQAGPPKRTLGAKNPSTRF